VSLNERISDTLNRTRVAEVQLSHPHHTSRMLDLHQGDGSSPRRHSVMTTADSGGKLQFLRSDPILPAAPASARWRASGLAARSSSLAGAVETGHRAWGRIFQWTCGRLRRFVWLLEEKVGTDHQRPAPAPGVIPAAPVPEDPLFRVNGATGAHVIAARFYIPRPAREPSAFLRCSENIESIQNAI